MLVWCWQNVDKIDWHNLDIILTECWHYIDRFLAESWQKIAIILTIMMHITWIKTTEVGEILTQCWFHVGTYLVKLAQNIYKMYQHTAKLRNLSNKYPIFIQDCTKLRQYLWYYIQFSATFVINMLPTFCHLFVMKIPTSIQHFVKMLSTYYQDYTNIYPRSRQDVVKFPPPNVQFYFRRWWKM